MIKINKNKMAILIGVFWLVLILGFIGIKEFTLQTGTQVLLKTRPVDPRDLFRGDYVILSYDISRVDGDTVVSGQSIDIGDTVYIELREVSGFANAYRIYSYKPSKGLFIKGKVKNDWNDLLLMEYGIESYFVPEGEGRELERARGGDLTVRVAIDKFGQAVIKDILLKGEEIDF